VRDAKRVWLNERISSIATDCKQTGVYRTALDELKGGLDRSTLVVKMNLRRQEAAAARPTRPTFRVLIPALDSVYNRSTSFDRAVLGLLPHLQLVDELADEPSAAEPEIAEHLKKAGEARRRERVRSRSNASKPTRGRRGDAQRRAESESTMPFSTFWRSETA
jgi:hypothetical protein